MTGEPIGCQTNPYRAFSLTTRYELCCRVKSRRAYGAPVLH